MKRRGVKKALITLVAAAVLFGGVKAYRAWEIAHRPEPAVAWVEYRPTPIEKLYAKHQVPAWIKKYAPALMGSLRLCASEAAGHEFWVVKTDSPKWLASEFDISPMWTLVDNGEMLEAHVEEIAQKPGEFNQKHYLLDLRTGNRIEVNFLPWNIETNRQPIRHFGNIELPVLAIKNYTPYAFSMLPLGAFWISNGLPTLFDPKDWRVMAVPIDDSGFSTNKSWFLGALDHPVGSGKTLVITSMIKGSGNRKWPAGKPSHRICFFNTDTNSLVAAYNAGAVLKDGKYSIVLFPSSDAMSTKTDVGNYSVENAFVRAQCIVPEWKNGSSLFILSASPRDEKDRLKRSCYLAQVDPGSGRYRQIPFPEYFQGVDSYRDKTHGLTKYRVAARSWYDQQNETTYILFDQDTRDKYTMLVLSKDEKWNQVFSYTNTDPSLVALAADRSIWIALYDDPKLATQGPCNLDRIDPKTGRQQTIRENVQIYDVYGSWLNDPTGN